MTFNDDKRLIANLVSSKTIQFLPITSVLSGGQNVRRLFIMYLVFCDFNKRTLQNDSDFCASLKDDCYREAKLQISDDG